MLLSPIAQRTLNSPMPTSVSLAPLAATPLPAMDIARGIAVMEQGALGKALRMATMGQGTQIIVTPDTGFADYWNKVVRIHPKVLEGGYSVPGVIAHELGHAYVDLHGLLGRLHKMPHRLGLLGNEIVAEAIASAIAVQSGFARGASSVTTSEGTLRTIRGALDSILGSDFYVKYYKIDLTLMTETVRAQAASTLLAIAREAITNLGGVTPPQYG